MNCSVLLHGLIGHQLRPYHSLIYWRALRLAFNVNSSECLFSFDETMNYSLCSLPSFYLWASPLCSSPLHWFCTLAVVEHWGESMRTPLGHMQSLHRTHTYIYIYSNVCVCVWRWQNEFDIQVKGETVWERERERQRERERKGGGSAGSSRSSLWV